MFDDHPLKDHLNALAWMSGILRQAANLSSIDNHVLCIGLLLFQRFARKEGFSQVDFRAVSVACLYLAAKISDKHLRLSKLLIMYFMAFQLKIVNKNRNLNLMKNSRLYGELKARVLDAEMRILQSMGFELYSFIKTAHIYLMYLYKNLKFSRRLFEFSWKVLNDLYCGFLVTSIPPHVLAIASVMMGYRKCREPMPATPWWLLYEVKEADVQVAIRAVLGFFKARTGDWDLKRLKQMFEGKGWVLKEDMGQAGNLAVRLEKAESVEKKEKDKKDKKKKKKKEKKSKKSGKRKKEDKEEKKKKHKNDKKKKSGDSRGSLRKRSRDDFRKNRYSKGGKKLAKNQKDKR